MNTGTAEEVSVTPWWYTYSQILLVHLTIKNVWIYFLRIVDFSNYSELMFDNYSVLVILSLISKKRKTFCATFYAEHYCTVRFLSEQNSTTSTPIDETSSG